MKHHRIASSSQLRTLLLLSLNNSNQSSLQNKFVRRGIHISHNHLTSADDKSNLNMIHEQVERAIDLMLKTHKKTKASELTITCCMSGGIDSTVTALLLQEAGVRIRSLFMSNWDARGEENSSDNAQEMCESVRLDWQDVKTVCSQFHIPHFHEALSPVVSSSSGDSSSSSSPSSNARPVRFIEEYWNHVFQKMIEGYEHGVTPNPDLLCNKHIKFNALFKYLDKMDTERDHDSLIATGHYAQLGLKPLNNDPTNHTVHLLRAKDLTKDQTFFLAQVDPKVFRQTIFPLGGLIKKTQVKDLLAKRYYKLPERIASKKESMGICFVGKRKRFSDFLADYIEPKPGPVLTISGSASNVVEHSKAFKTELLSKWGSQLAANQHQKLVGHHNGTSFYTIGQTYRLSGSKEKLHVCAKDHENNIVYVAGASNSHQYLDLPTFNTYDAHWLVPDIQKLLSSNIPLSTKIRHAEHIPQPCKLHSVENKNSLVVEAEGDTVFNCVAPGQTAVFYAKDEAFEDLVCVGSAIITDKDHNVNK